MSDPHAPEGFDPFAGPALSASAPTTEPQREIWTAARLGDDASLAFNESVTLSLRGPLDLPALRAAVADLLARHEALRATLTPDGLTLLVSDGPAAELPLEDLTPLTEAERDARLAARAETAVTTPFDLERGPLVRLSLHRLAADDHRLLFTAHHLVCDGFSTGVLLRDLGQLYTARRRGERPSLPAAEPFTRYAAALRERAGSAAAADDERYWLGRFAGELPVLELPTDRARPPRKTYASLREDAAIGSEALSDLKRAAGKLRSSLFAVLLAGLHALLARLTGQEDVVVGVPAAGQSDGEGHDTLVGHAVNLLPIRASAFAGRPFAELAADVRGALLDAFEHQGLTFGALLARLPVARDPSRLPLVSVVFNLDRGLGSDALGFDGLVASVITNPRRYENFDLFVNAVEIEGHLELECQFNSDLLDRATVARWLAAYARLLASAVRDPGAVVGDLDVLPPGDLERLAAWNRTLLPLPPGRTVPELIRAQIAATPGAVALEVDGAELTYAELGERAARLSRRLRELGAGRGALVGLLLERTADLVVALLAVLESGAGYVPLDPGYPRERLAYMAEDAGLAVIVSDSRTLAELDLSTGTPLLLDREATALAGLSPEPLPPGELTAGPEDVAYVIYTSGSTGRPKGVLVPHRGVVNLLASVAVTPGMSADDRVLALTTLSFDIAVSEVILPLTVGARIVLVGREIAADGARLLEVMRRRGVTFVDATPATYRLLLAAGFDGHPRVRAICTGEAMPRDLAEALLPLVTELWNGYGPTETTVWSTFHRVQAPVGRILIGRPIANTQIHVLDPRGRPVPVGVTGELHIGGRGVALGYRGREDLTRERFLPDPFAGAPGATMYRTGDLGRYLGSGELECLGRNDGQVKLRGFRIELGEIEGALGLAPGVRECAVTVREDRPGDRRLVAYLSLHEGAAPAEEDLRAALRRVLPDYMLPSTWVTLPRLPLTPSGKIDRRALPPPAQGDPSARADFVAPEGPREELIAGLFAEALGLPRVSVTDDFFGLGGHSLLASQVLARLRRDHGIELPFRRLFEAPTARSLARALDTDPPPQTAAVIRRIERRSAPGPAPLSTAQRRLVLLEALDPSTRLVHALPAALRVTGTVDLGILQRALDEIARRHEPLRTTLLLGGREPQQVAAATASLPIEEVDLSGLPDAQREAALDAAMADRTRVPFDLERGPLFRSTLFRLGGDASVYFTVRHNVIWDGWSFDVFLRELGTLYGAFSAGRPSPLPALPITYADYVTWHRAELGGPEMARQIAHWQARLAGEPEELRLPSDRPRPRRSEHRGANLSTTFTRGEAETLTALGRDLGATLFMVAFAGYVATLHRHSGQGEIVVGTPVRARSRPEVEDLVGPFINAVVLRVPVSPEVSFRELVERVRDVTLDAFSHQDMPLELLGARAPVVRAFFSFQDARSRLAALGDLPVKQLHVEPPAAANDLMLWMMDTRDELLAFANYSAELFEAPRIARLLEAFRTLLLAAAAAPATAIGALPLASPASLGEAERLGRPLSPAPREISWGDGGALVLPPEGGLRLGGDIVRGDALLARVTAVREALSRAGAGPGARILVTASVPSAAALAALAVLAAGGTVVPLDPAEPEERRGALLAGFGGALLLGDGPSPAGATDLGAASTSDPRLHLYRLAAPGSAAAGEPFSQGGTAPAALLPRLGARGEPELVAITRSDAAIGAAALAAALDAAPGARLWTSLPLAADAFVPLLTLLGAGLVLDTSPARTDAELAALLPEEVSSLRPGDAVPRAVLVLGAPPRELVRPLLDRGLRLASWSMLPGPLGASFVGAADDPGGLAVLGRPLAPHRVQIRSEGGLPCPLGVPGRLHVGRGDQALTPTPLLARLRDDGAVLLEPAPLGPFERGGTWHAPEPLARGLERHPAVAAAAVVEAPDGTLTALVVPRSGAPLTETELRRVAREHLPAPLVPRRVVELPELPVRADGRLDLRRVPGLGGPEAHEHEPPRTATERAVARIYEELLGVAPVGVTDNFFDLGGQSLGCFRAIDAIDERLGARLGPRVLLLGTVEQVAAEIDGAAAQDQSSGRTRATEAPRPPAHRAAPAGLAGRVIGRLRGLVKR